MAEVKMNGTEESHSNYYAGSTRFEIELEFIQCLSNPLYIQHLATNKYFDDPAFVNYLSYLEYWRQPEYLKYLQYPGPTLRTLELLQQEQFRRDAVNPAVIDAMIREGLEKATEGLK